MYNKKTEEFSKAAELLERLEKVTHKYSSKDAFGRYLEIQKVCYKGQKNPVALNFAIRDYKGLYMEFDEVIPVDSYQVTKELNEILGWCSKYINGEEYAIKFAESKKLECDGTVVPKSREEEKVNERVVRFSKFA